MNVGWTIKTKVWLESLLFTKVAINGCQQETESTHERCLQIPRLQGKPTRAQHFSFDQGHNTGMIAIMKAELLLAKLRCPHPQRYKAPIQSHVGDAEF
jgi:hypothetical protein